MNNNDYDIKDIKKISLREDLIGSIPFSAAKKMAGIQYIHSHANIKSAIREQSEYNCANFDEFKKSYSEVYNLFHECRDYVTSVYNLLKTNEENNVYYTEITMSPYRMMITNGEYDTEAYNNRLKSANFAIDLAKKDFGDIKTDLVPYEDENLWKKEGEQINNIIWINETGKNQQRFMRFSSGASVKVDFKEIETVYSTKHVWELFKKGINRINSSVAIANDDKLVTALAENNVLLEISPTKDLSLFEGITIENHPFKKLYECGVRVSINANSGGILNTNIGKEYKIIKNTFEMDWAQMWDITFCSLEASHIPTKLKNQLINDLYKKHIPKENLQLFKESAMKSKNEILKNRLLQRAQRIYE